MIIDISGCNASLFLREVTETLSQLKTNNSIEMGVPPRLASSAVIMVTMVTYIC